MRKETELTGCISGSFKFKPEIDSLIDEFRDLGAIILSPEKGWVTLPRHRLLRLPHPKFRPLPMEQRATIKRIEDNFLKSVTRSDFLYVANFEGYTGQSTNLEIGFAFGKGIPVFSVVQMKNDEYGDLWFGNILEQIKNITPTEVVEEIRNKKDQGESHREDVS